MNTCSFFHEEIQKIESKEIRPDRQFADVRVLRLPWCNHKHSLVPKRIATASIGGANALACGGSLEKCPIPKEQLADI